MLSSDGQRKCSLFGSSPQPSLSVIDSMTRRKAINCTISEEIQCYAQGCSNPNNNNNNININNNKTLPVKTKQTHLRYDCGSKSNKNISASEVPRSQMLLTLSTHQKYPIGKDHDKLQQRFSSYQQYLARKRDF